jgi:hypothetical protein
VRGGFADRGVRETACVALAVLPSVLQLIGTVAAAVAAVASLMSVLQSRRVIRDASLPALRAEVVYVDPPGSLAIEIHNVGGGIARAVWMLVAIEDRYVKTGVAAFLRPGESTSIGTDVKPASRSSIAAGVFVWRDASEHIHAWSLRGETIRLRVQDGEGVTAAEAWRRLYPDRDLKELKCGRTLKSGLR